MPSGNCSRAAENVLITVSTDSRHVRTLSRNSPQLTCWLRFTARLVGTETTGERNNTNERAKCHQQTNQDMRNIVLNGDFVCGLIDFGSQHTGRDGANDNPLDVQGRAQGQAAHQPR